MALPCPRSKWPLLHAINTPVFIGKHTFTFIGIVVFIYFFFFFIATTFRGTPIFVGIYRCSIHMCYVVFKKQKPFSYSQIDGIIMEIISIDLFVIRNSFTTFCHCRFFFFDQDLPINNLYHGRLCSAVTQTIKLKLNC